MKFKLSVMLLSLLCLTACVPGLPGPTPTATRTPYTPEIVTATSTTMPTPVPTATPSALGVYFAPEIPAGLRARTLAALGAGYVERTAPDADVRVLVEAPQESGAEHYLLSEFLLVPAVAFPTISDDIAWADVQAYWQGDPARLAALGGGTAPTLYVDADTLSVLTTLLGPAAAGVPVQVVDDVAAAVWDARPAAWALVPFDRLVPQLKVLTVDGRSTLTRQFDAEGYPLRVRYALYASEAVATQLDIIAHPWLTRDPERMTVLMMTGVTALGRATAWKMELNGILYPDQKVRDILLDHDLLHISNEVSFSPDCPPPDPNGDTRFCASPRYIDLLKDIHVDIVELSGNHNNDYGEPASRYSLDMYAELGWRTFAGGRDDVAARTPLTITDHGNTLVFLGCNPVGPEYAWADVDYAGAAVCDYPAMYAQIGRARAVGAFPIVTWQYFEGYQYAIPWEQARDFRAMADAGAGLVSGSQAHHPQGFDFYSGAEIDYGLGNLFFDQMDMLGTRQEFAAQHILYDGRLLSTRLYSFMLEDYAQPRPMTAQERAEFLQAVFEASGW